MSGSSAGRVGAILPVLVTGIALALALLAARRVAIDNDITRLLPDSDPVLAQTTRALQGLLDRTLVDVGSPDGSRSLEELGAAADRLAEGLVASGTVARAQARLELGRALELAELVRARAPLFLDATAWAALEAKLAPDAVRAAIRALERRLQEPDGMVLASTASSDPLGIAALALTALASSAAVPPGAELVDGTLASADGRHVLVLVEPGFPPGDHERTTGFLDALERIRTELARELPGIELASTGAHRSGRDNEEQVRRDVKLTSLLGTGLVALLALLCLGRARLVLLSLSPALVGGVLAAGIFALFRDTVSGPVLGFGSVLVGLTIDFAIHVLTVLTRPGGAGKIPRLSLFMGALTTSLAFALLRGSALPGMRDMGTFGALGIMAAVAYALWVLPSLAPLLGRPKAPPVSLERLFTRATSAAPSTRAASIALLLTPLVAFGATRLAFDGDVRHLSSLSPAAAADEGRIQSVWGGAKVTALLVEAASEEAALEANDDLAETLARAQRDGLLLGHASLAGALPARRTQEERATRWKAFWTPERRSELAENVRAAAGATRFRADAFAPFLASLETAPAPVTRAELEASGGVALVSERLVHDGDTWRVSTPVYTSGWEQLERLRARLAQERPAVLIANREAVLRRVAELVGEEMVSLGGLAFLMVAAVVYTWLGEALLTALVLLPLALGLAWTLGLFGWLGAPLNLVNAVFVVLQFGISIDYSIFLTAAYLERYHTRHDGTAEARASVLLCALTTVAGFGAMAFAGHPVLSSIGTTAGVGIACAALAAQLFVPPLAGALLSERGLALGAWLQPGRAPAWRRALARRYRFHGALVRHYAASKAKRDPLVAALPELCAGEGSILVVGCGYGVMTTRLAQAFPERTLVALDPDERKLARARSAAGPSAHASFLPADVRSFAPPQRFERVLLVDVLHYWDEAGQREILEKVRAALAPGARLVFRDGCAGAGQRHWIVHGFEALAGWTGFTRVPGRLTFHDEGAWRALLQAGGFRVEESLPKLGLLSNLVLVCSTAEGP